EDCVVSGLAAQDLNNMFGIDRDRYRILIGSIDNPRNHPSPACTACFILSAGSPGLRGYSNIRSHSISLNQDASPENPFTAEARKWLHRGLRCPVTFKQTKY